VKDQAGMSVGEALKETLKAAPAVKRAERIVPDSYIEAHIEQGPRLENEGKTIGVVTLIQGQRRFLIDIIGEEAHAGTTPERVRKDAFKAAAAMVAALEPVMHDPQDVLRFTIGRFEVYPGSPSTVPSKVHFIIDLRHPDPETIKRLGDQIEGICLKNARGCEVKVTPVSYVQPCIFPKQIVDLVRDSAAALKLPHMDIVSGAGHDAMYVAKLCPSGMIFVPCERGISHNESENATSSDLAAGARVLADALMALANR
jgi:N-carbamoyl-L-amino-acid hydrolase